MTLPVVQLIVSFTAVRDLGYFLKHAQFRMAELTAKALMP
jgi:hypothetical protein